LIHGKLFQGIFPDTCHELNFVVGTHYWCMSKLVRNKWTSHNIIGVCLAVRLAGVVLQSGYFIICCS
jgi:hypothetical protein